MKAIIQTGYGSPDFFDMVEQVTGMKYEAYIREYVFKPVGLSKAEIDFEVSDPTLQAKGYHKKNSEYQI